MSSAGFAGLHLLRAALEQKMGNIADDSLFDSNDSLIHSRPDPRGLLAQDEYYF